MSAKGQDGQAPLFSDRESLKAWLEDKPTAWAAILARRSALRAAGVLPALLSGAPSRSAAFHAFRTLFILHSSSSDYARARAAAANAAAAAYAAANAAAADAAYDAAYAANAGAAAYAADDAEKLWAQLNRDAEQITRSDSVVRLRRLALWDGAPPDQIVSGFNRFLTSDIVASPLSFWVVWYRAILLNKPTSPIISEKVAAGIAQQGKAFWEEREPEDVTAEIARRAGWDWEKEPVGPQPKEWPGWPDPPAGADRKDRAQSPTVRERDDEPAKDHEGDTELEPLITDDTNMLADAATADDGLGRRGFAEALATRIRQVHGEEIKDSDAQGFAVNIHAPWGSGKSSVLKMLEQALRPEGAPKDRWVVVHFNAWRHERRNPPWWPLLETLRSQAAACVRQDDWWAWKFWQLWGRWACWAFMGSWLPVIAAVGLPLVFIAGVSNLISGGGDARGLIAIGTGLVTLAGTAFVLARGAVFGSKQNADHHSKLTRDPLHRMRRLFESVVAICDRPVCIFIDDLDRCDADYVVDLLEGIQTTFRHPSVVYVVAADRKWIKAAFEKRYGDPFSQVESVGQPLGYHFLEKIFQLSTPLPAPSQEVQLAYWRSLLGNDGPEAEGEDANSDEVPVDRASIARQFDPDDGVKEMKAKISKLEEEGASREVVKTARSVAYEKAASSKEVEREAKHRLFSLAQIIRFNPRAMKRLVNTYTLRVGEGLLEDDGIEPDALARWLVLEHTYPELTEWLAEHPEWAKEFGADKDGSSEPLTTERPTPEGFNIYLSAPSIKAIFTANVEGLEFQLTVGQVRKLVRGMV